MGTDRSLKSRNHGPPYAQPARDSNKAQQNPRFSIHLTHALPSLFFPQSVPISSADDSDPIFQYGLPSALQVPISLGVLNADAPPPASSLEADQSYGTVNGPNGSQLAYSSLDDLVEVCRFAIDDPIDLIPHIL